VRALAVTAPQRQVDLPDVPTTREAGMPDYTYGSFFGVYVRTGTPPDVVRRLNTAINTITTIPDVVERFRALGAVATQSTPEEAIVRYQGDIARLRDLVARAKIPPAD
jgi:tripartite-type tricarboxylate transporter receptor subunit TctC